MPRAIYLMFISLFEMFCGLLDWLLGTFMAFPLGKFVLTILCIFGGLVANIHNFTFKVPPKATI